MGITDSLPDNSSVELDEEKLYLVGKNNHYSKRYNLVPSYKNDTYEVMDKNFFNNKNTDLPGFIDLRKSFPSIIEVKTLPFNTLACVSYLLEYSLLKNDLAVFPPSLMFIYKHCKFFNGVSDLISFETIFKSIRSKGFCIETEFRTNKNNLSCESIPNNLYEKAIPYKFIKVYRVLNNLTDIKTVLLNEYPILIGFSVYSKLSRISDKLWIPDHNTEQNMGGIGGVLVGFMEERKLFIMAQTYGKNFGQNGYILVPYEYILNKNYTFEMYALDVDKKRVNGYLNHNKPVVSLNGPDEEAPPSSGGFLSNLFS